MKQVARKKISQRYVALHLEVPDFLRFILHMGADNIYGL
jgi:hypothetical protein